MASNSSLSSSTRSSSIQHSHLATKYSDIYISMFDKIYRLILSNIESLARATGDDANETDGTEEVGSRPRSNCTSTNLVKLLQEWDRLDRCKDGFLLHTWDQTLDSGSCEICLLATDEVAHTGMYKDGIHNLRCSSLPTCFVLVDLYRLHVPF